MENQSVIKEWKKVQFELLTYTLGGGSGNTEVEKEPSDVNMSEVELLSSSISSYIVYSSWLCLAAEKAGSQCWAPYSKYNDAMLIFLRRHLTQNHEL